MARPHVCAFQILPLFALALMSLQAEVHAGIILGTPKIKVIGDPEYLYSVPVYLDPANIISSATGPSFLDPINNLKDDYLTIYNINGFQNFVGFYSDPGLTHTLTDFSAIGKADGTGYTPPAQTAPPSVPGTADLSLYLLAGYPSITNTGSGELLLGYLVFQTDLPENVPPTTTLDYTWQDHTGNPPKLQSGFGSVSAIPEPGPLALLGLGVATVWLGRRVEGRSSRGRSSV